MDLSEDFCWHPSEDTLELYALQRLPEDQMAPIEEHLLHCAECQNVLAQTEKFARLMQAALRPPVWEPEVRTGMRAWLPRLDANSV